MVDLVTVIYLFYIFVTLYMTTLILFIYLKNRKKYFSDAEKEFIPGLSVLIPAYNEERTIGDTIKAVLNCEYPRDKLEVIIVNDGSTDKTAEIVKQFKDVKLLDKSNSGKADSMNQALKIAKHDFIAIIDADSYPEKDALIKMVNFFYDNEVGAVTGSAFVKNKNSILEKMQALEYVAIAWTRRLLDFLDSALSNVIILDLII